MGFVRKFCLIERVSALLILIGGSLPTPALATVAFSDAESQSLSRISDFFVQNGFIALAPQSPGHLPYFEVDQILFDRDLKHQIFVSIGAGPDLMRDESSPLQSVLSGKIENAVNREVSYQILFSGFERKEADHLNGKMLLRLNQTPLHTSWLKGIQVLPSLISEAAADDNAGCAGGTTDFAEVYRNLHVFSSALVSHAPPAVNEAELILQTWKCSKTFISSAWQETVNTGSALAKTAIQVNWNMQKYGPEVGIAVSAVKGILKTSQDVLSLPSKFFLFRDLVHASAVEFMHANPSVKATQICSLLGKIAPTILTAYLLKKIPLDGLLMELKAEARLQMASEEYRTAAALMKPVLGGYQKFYQVFKETPKAIWRQDIPPSLRRMIDRFTAGEGGLGKSLSQVHVRDFYGKSRDEIAVIMKKKGFTRITTCIRKDQVCEKMLSGKPFPQDLYYNPDDASLIRIKPEGGPDLREAPHGVKSVVNQEGLPPFPKGGTAKEIQDYSNRYLDFEREAFKVDDAGIPVPKNPAMLATPLVPVGITGAAAEAFRKAFIDAWAECAHSYI